MKYRKKLTGAVILVKVRCKACRGSGIQPELKRKRLKENKIDAVFSKFIRNRDKKCQRCGSVNNLQCAHIFSRTARSVRWDEDNCLTLCYKCHLFWAHKNPIEFAEFIKEYLKEPKYTELRHRSQIVKKWTKDEKQELFEKYSLYYCLQPEPQLSLFESELKKI